MTFQSRFTLISKLTILILSELVLIKGSAYHAGKTDFSSHPKRIPSSVVVTSTDPFVTTWKTDNPGTSTNTQITIPTTGGGYNYSVYWEEVGNASNNGTLTEQSGSTTIEFGVAGIYSVEITGDFPRIYFSNSGDKEKILTVEQWGDNVWQSMAAAFWGAANMDVVAIDVPDLSQVTDISFIFAFTNLTDGNLGSWNVGNVINMFSAFAGASSFNADIGNWNVSNVQNMNGMFISCTSFNQDIGNWNVGNVTNMGAMFGNASLFNQNIANWNVGNVIFFNSMFNDATAFNQNIGSWNTANAENMEWMFFGAASFDQPIGSWNVSKVNDMSQMFRGASLFNQDLSGWVVSNVTDMSFMFYQADTFNQDISGWNVSGVQNMSWMFYDTPFNQDISGWNTINVTNMSGMFGVTSDFDYSLGSWDISNVTDMTTMFAFSNMSLGSYDNTLIGWAAQMVQPDVRLDAQGLDFCLSETARNTLLSSNWNIVGDSKNCQSFITIWNTSGASQITIPTTGSGYDYFIYWEEVNNVSNNGILSNQTSDAIVDFGTPGIYQVEIYGDFPRIYFNNTGDKDKLITIEQWGGNKWSSMAQAFKGATSLNINASDSPDLSEVTNLTEMFSGASALNVSLGDWNISSITDMTDMLSNSGLTRENYDLTLFGWADQSVQPLVTLGTTGLTYCGANTARGTLTSSPNDWTISGDVLDCPPAFITTWKTDNPGISANNQISIPIIGVGYDFDVYYEKLDNPSVNGTVNGLGELSTTTITFPEVGTYRIEITGDFPSIRFNNTGDKEKILTVEQWGSNTWSSMNNAFSGCVNLTVPATDAPDLSNVGSAAGTAGMFAYTTSFDEPINHWDMSGIANISFMFGFSGFNRDLSNWDVSSVTNMDDVFSGAFAFDQDISSWDFSSVTDIRDFVESSGLSAENYDKLLTKLSTVVTLPSSEIFNASGQFYCASESARQMLINSKSWVIFGDQKSCPSTTPFITTWKTDNPGISSDDQITIPNSGTGKYDIYWEDIYNSSINGILEKQIGSSTITFPSAGTYQVQISGHLQNLFFANGGDREKILTIDQWGDMEWASFNYAFGGCINLIEEANDAPNLSSVSNMSLMFFNASSFRSDIGDWDIRNVTNMQNILSNTSLSQTDYDNTLTGWSAQLGLQSDVQVGATGLYYCGSENDRQSLIDTYNWTFSGDNQGCPATTPYITVWKTDNVGTSEDDQITLPNTGVFDVYWEDVNDANVNGSISDVRVISTFDLEIITFPSVGTYRVEITGIFPEMSVFSHGDAGKLLMVEQWGNNEWSNLQYAFRGYSNMTMSAVDGPDLSNTTRLTGMFENASSFNGAIGGWDVSSIEWFSSMFRGASSFNQALENWDMSNAQFLNSMFQNALLFNQDISGWTVGNATTMSFMFSGASAFDQDLGGWNLGSVTSLSGMLDNSGMSIESFDNTISGWSQQTIPSGITLGATGLNFCDSYDDFVSLISSPNNWDIQGASPRCSGAFVTVWKTDNIGISGDNQIIIPTTNSIYSSPTGFVAYDYDIYWEDMNDANVNGSLLDQTGSASGNTITFPTAGTYRVEITGDFPAINFGGSSGGDRLKIVSIEEWGGIFWAYLNRGFASATNLSSNATDRPNLQAVANMDFMFSGASNFNGDVSNWDVSNVTNMWGVFQNATSFDQNLENWDISNVTDLRDFLLFSGISTENYDLTLTGWNNLPSLQSDITIGVNGLIYCQSESARQNIIDTYNWTFVGDDIQPPVPDEPILDDLTDQCQVSAPTAPTATSCFGAVNGTTDAVFPITTPGTTVITWTYEDASGNMSTQTQNVVIADVSAPVADEVSLSDLEAECSIGSATAPTATDNCDGSIIGTTDAIFPITSSTTIIWTFEDVTGNSSTQTQNVVLADISAPVADELSLPDLEAECSVGSATAPTATDNCDGSITGTTDAIFPITSNTTITWTYEDASGNMSTQTQNVVIADVSAPVVDEASLPDLEAECSIGSATAPTATDNCDGLITGTTDAIFPITSSVTITWTFEDATGNTSTQTQNVVIADVSAPVADELSLPDLEAECSIGSATAPTATDNCDGSITGTTDAIFPITSSVTITWTFEDATGNTSTQTQNVVIADISAPVADELSLPDLEAECSVGSATAPTATDNCDGSITGTTDAIFPITSSVTITWTFEDATGNASTQTQNVVIADISAPVADELSLPDLEAECSVGSATAPTATDNCDGSITGATDAIFPITSNTTITWTYEDASGNMSTQTQNVVIADISAPVADELSLPDLEAECSVGSATAPTATDNCDGSITGATDAIFPITSNTTITWTYEDASGNMSTQTQNVVIADISAPVADELSLPDLEAECSVGSATAPTATDNCDGSITGATDAIFPITSNTTITWTYEDASGNMSTQTQNVEIADVSSPVADELSLPDLEAECSVVSATAPTATDNCDGSITGATDAIFPITSNTTITWTYEDASGNMSTQTQNVEIADVSSPVADELSLPDLEAECSVVSATAPTATDNCDGSITGTTDAIFPITSSTTIIWTFEDATGNISTQTQNVVIADVSSPVADELSLPDLEAECSVVSATAPTATDNCDGSITGTTDAIFPITSSTTIIWTFEDATGNISTQTQNVVIADVSSPVADELSLPDLEAECSVVSATAPTATDNCDGSITGTTDAIFPITSSTTIIWTFEDATGNISTQTQNVVIADVSSPVADELSLPDLEAECSVVSATAPTATDNCDGSITGTTDAIFPITSSTTIIWTFEDVTGNSSTQTQNVVIADVSAPVADELSLPDLEAECSIGSATAPTATDNCDGSITGATDAIFPITSNTTITWTYEDATGNTSTQTQNVVIADVTAPIPTILDLATITTDCDGTIQSATAPTATDNCSGQIIGTTNQLFPFAPTEGSQILWEYVDGNGNTAIQFQDIVIIETDAVTIEESLCAEQEFMFPDGTLWTGEASQVSTLTNQQGCDSLITTNITVLPEPDVALLGADEVFGCVGEELTFSIDESSVDFTTYTISTLFGNSSTDSPLTFEFSNALAAATTTGDLFVTVELTSADGCIGTDQVQLFDNTIINWGIGAIQNDDPTITISGSTLPETGDSFSWDFGDGTTNSTDVNPTHTYEDNGTYTVTLTVTNECGSESLSSSVTIAGIEAPLGLDNAELYIYPVPTRRFVNIDHAEPITVRIYSLDGRQALETIKRPNTVLDLGDLQSGHYLMKLFNENRLITTEKLVKIN